jgi:ribA/ribD-fused uncharacterized protein
MKSIRGFIRQYRFLSNFYPSPIIFDKVLYPTAEHAYQASKLMDIDAKIRMSNLSTPGEAKKMGRYVVLAPNWDSRKLDIMQQIVFIKFITHKDLKAMLLDTEDMQLIEENNWGDTFWGISQGVGENNLGKILMIVRDHLRRNRNENFI